MRKVKVAAALFCVMTAGLLGGTAVPGRDWPAANTDQLALIQEITAESAASAVYAAPTATAASSDASAEPEGSEPTTETTAAAVSGTADTPETGAAETEEITTAYETALTGETSGALTQPAISAAPLSFSVPAQTVTAAPALTVPATTASTAATTVTTVTTVTTAATAVTTTSTTTAAPTPAPQASGNAITVTQAEYYMLCNVVAHEYGADWVPVEEKALVAEVIMNRVNSPLFPNTIYGVLTQKNQFSGLQKLIELGTFSSQVTDSVKAAVDLYLSDPSQFDHGYLFFSGDGTRNYFRTTY
ncbi:MAG: cell wall hydrolase [Oscillospiraceae bacterium]|nr:cell wall hydrolase [Oscillospiraceae bacterium]